MFHTIPPIAFVDDLRRYTWPGILGWNAMTCTSRWARFFSENHGDLYGDIMGLLDRPHGDMWWYHGDITSRYLHERDIYIYIYDIRFWMNKVNPHGSLVICGGGLESQDSRKQRELMSWPVSKSKPQRQNTTWLVVLADKYIYIYIHTLYIYIYTQYIHTIHIYIYLYTIYTYYTYIYIHIQIC